MTSYVANKVAKHVLKEGAENHFGSDDPYFEQVAAVDMNGRATGKYTKRKRAIPPGLTKQEEKVLKKVTRRAHRLDQCFSFCGIRVGWGTIIGIIPAAGDVVDALMAFMVVWTCTQAKIPAALKSRMIMNIALDFGIGLVPFLGDIADAFFRCNTRNAALLWKHLQARGAERIKEEEERLSGGGGEAQVRTESRGRTQQQAGRPQPDAIAEVPGQQVGGDGAGMSEKTPARPHSSRRQQQQQQPQQQEPHQQHMHQVKPQRNEVPSAGAAQGGRYVNANDLTSKPKDAKVKSEKGSGGGWLSRFSSNRGPERDLENGEGRPEMSQQRS